MNLRNIAITSLLIILLIGNFVSCTSEEEAIPVMNPGNYERIYHVESTIGENSTTTRAIESDRFTTDYDAEAIYIHSLTGENRVVKYNVQENLPDCPDCQGIRIKYTISEDGKSVTLIGDDNVSQAFSLTEEVYLSSIADENWTHESCGTTPITQSVVLSRDETKNVELYRSAENHSITDFLQGTGGCARGILMDRVCTAFRVYFLFSNLKSPVQIGDATAYPSPTNEQLAQIGINNVTNLAAKVYLGPMFCTSFDLNTLKAQNNADVYYATSNNQYQNLQSTSVSDVDYQEDKSITYGGYGITSPAGYLITPYNKEHTGGYHFYAFIKNGNSNPNSDEGALYTEWTIDTDATGALDFNQCEVIIIVYDYSQLAAFAQTTTSSNEATTRNYWKTPQRIDIKPEKVIRVRY